MATGHAGLGLMMVRQWIALWTDLGRWTDLGIYDRPLALLGQLGPPGWDPPTGWTPTTARPLRIT
jgi:hypothetical protein